jgi:hypothetical protein
MLKTDGPGPRKRAARALGLDRAGDVSTPVMGSSAEC